MRLRMEQETVVIQVPSRILKCWPIQKYLISYLIEECIFKELNVIGRALLLYGVRAVRTWQ